MRSFVVVICPPFFDALPGIGHRDKPGSVQALGTKPPVEVFAVAVFPGTAWLNQQSLPADPRKSRWDFGWDYPGKPRHCGQRPAPENPVKSSFPEASADRPPFSGPDGMLVHDAFLRHCRLEV